MSVKPAERLRRKDLVGIDPLSPGEIQLILDTADQMRDIAARPIKKVPALRGKTVVNLFMEASTRTRFSFEVAEKRLSADSLSFSAAASSVSKGETLVDTALNLEAMQPDFIVIRHFHAGAPHQLARILKSSVINAGDGAHEHPTQALLDALTMRLHRGTLEGQVVAIVGDLQHSRVVRSNVLLLSRMGATVRVAAPPSLIPLGMEKLGCEVHRRIEDAIAGADVVMMLRIQLERQGRMNFPTVREYYDFFALTPERLKLAKRDCLVMHPGPMNRGVEIDSRVADGPQSVILEQVTNGVAVRMAVLYLLAGGHGEPTAD
ncbi:MAG: aspartate carbamoyltransferase [Acidobacteria bacterium 21-70-11]|nr:MAG: aspartate carbamoyltransferase [Acidobacteria bacterium 21-70-11]OYW05694.1 MAG: aspartate carbamoyltransferase [Acidobacteria bacterium 37-71-11]HQU34151.1 aspartate carbamoyltransferase catalytic subunit [Thermoanaerobaculaceae bacterium]